MDADVTAHDLFGSDTNNASTSAGERQREEREYKERQTALRATVGERQREKREYKERQAALRAKGTAAKERKATGGDLAARLHAWRQQQTQRNAKETEEFATRKAIGIARDAAHKAKTKLPNPFDEYAQKFKEYTENKAKHSDKGTGKKARQTRVDGSASHRRARPHVVDNVMQLIHSDLSRQKRISNRLDRWTAGQTRRRPNRVRTGADVQRNRRIGKSFKKKMFVSKDDRSGEHVFVQNVAQGFDGYVLMSNGALLSPTHLRRNYMHMASVNNYRLEAVIENGDGAVRMLLTDGKHKFQVHPLVLKLGYEATGTLAQQQTKNSDAKRYQRLKQKVIRMRTERPDAFVFRAPLNATSGGRLMLAPQTIDDIIFGARPNPENPLGPLNDDEVAHLLRPMLQKGIRVNASGGRALPGGKMLGVGAATGDQAQHMMGPLSLVSEYFGGKRQKRARFHYAPSTRSPAPTGPNTDEFGRLRALSNDDLERLDIQLEKRLDAKRATRNAKRATTRAIGAIEKRRARRPVLNKVTTLGTARKTAPIAFKKSKAARKTAYQSKR